MSENTPPTETTANSEQMASQGGQDWHGFVLTEMQQGTDKAGIAEKLHGQGLELRKAEEVVEPIYQEVLSLASQQQLGNSTLLPGLGGGLLAALVGGGIWGFLTVKTGYEIGYVAWGIGLLAGYAVVFCAKGQRGMPLQLMATFSAALGILLGKYFTLYGFILESAATEAAASGMAAISPFSLEMALIFVLGLPEMVSGFDILWVVLALGSAWGIPKSLGVDVSKYPDARFHQQGGM